MFDQMSGHLVIQSSWHMMLITTCSMKNEKEFITTEPIDIKGK